MSAPVVIANPWLLYNLQSDPFFQEPLTAGPGTAYPVGELFVGRESEVRQLGAQVLGSTSSRALVQGPAGVGKTSVVQNLKAAAADQGVLTHVDAVRIVSGMTAGQFCAEVLRTLLQIRAARTLLTGQDARKGKRRSHRQALKPTSSRARADTQDSDRFWRRVTRVLEGEDASAVGLSLASIGGSLEPTRIAAERTDLSLFHELNEAFRLLGDGTHRVLVHINNLENLTGTDIEAATRLLQDVRDVLLTAHSHWVFVGAEDIGERVFARVPQLSGILPLVVTLAPLSPDEVEVLLEKRYRHLARGIRYVPPVEPSVGARVYRRYHGDLRNFLRLLSRAAQHHAIRAAPEPMTEAAILTTMSPLYLRDLVHHIGESDVTHLRRLVEAAGTAAAHDVFRVSEVQTRLKVAQSTASDMVERWLERGVIRHASTSGKSVYYRLSGDTRIALGVA